jgi:succinate dehydrogenase / fumarate reductase cytochrome b subunit
VQQRPVFLNLFQIRFPLTAIVSIMHRISGILMFLFIPFMLSILQMSLVSQNSFDELRLTFNHPLIKISILLILSATIYHTLAGLRHIIMDLGFGDSRALAKISSILVLTLAILTILWLGIRLW